MNYQINFIPEALADMKKLDHSVRPQIVKGIQEVSQNPLSIYQGGYGKPLGNKDSTNLAGLFKIKFRRILNWFTTMSAYTVGTIFFHLLTFLEIKCKANYASSQNKCVSLQRSIAFWARTSATWAA